MTDKGEQWLGAAGEVHLETCVKDLRERFARVGFQARRCGGRGGRSPGGGLVCCALARHPIKCGLAGPCRPL